MSKPSPQTLLSLRILGYYVICGLFWALWCLGPLLRGDHAAFQASGTIIIVAAIIRIGLDRLRFEEAINSADRNALISAINRLEAHRVINEERLNTTFDLHMLQISQLSAHLKVPNPIGPSTQEEIRSFAKELDTRTKGQPTHYTVEEDKKLTEDIGKLDEIRAEFPAWKKHAFRCELFFLAFGTLQSGYGASWSEQLNNLIR